MFEGSIVALVTPFKNGEVDEAKLKELIEFHIENGTHGIVPCGTTGESATLSHEEHERVIDITVETVGGRIPVIAGTGSNSTAEALRLTKHAKEAGADAVLLITPYYNKPTQEGMYRHFMTIADAVDIPMILYNVPSRTGIDLLPETVARLAEHPNIVGIKEATGSLRRASEIIQACGEDFILLSGDDFVTLPMMAVGGRGVISVAANIIPSQLAKMCELAKAGDFAAAREIHNKYFPLFEALFLETNPIPVKTAMRMMGMINGELRLPLCPMSEANEKKLEEVLRRCGLLK
ncbi:4-hydroxy-tetrahydrodipicolinate synthase [Candidatus Poribacteria bacterium]|nr:MAG: 4-hydroxy-tetrahydrodipicolinate synthase [Candidatus Poribacteria bacterium]